jgi:hypothetical protein
MRLSFNLNDLPRTGGGSSIEPLDAGAYPARIVGMIKVGQHVAIYKGEEKPARHVMYVMYEFLDEFLKNDEGEDDLAKPRWLNENFNLFPLDTPRAKCGERYTGLDPNNEFGGDFSKLVGLPVIVTVVKDPGKDGKVYNNIDAVSVMRPKEAAKAPPLVNPTVLFDFDDPDAEAWEKMPKWLQEKAQKAVDYPGSALEAMVKGAPVRGTTAAPKGDVVKDADEENW